MKQRIILAIVKELMKYLDGYHLCRNGGKKGKKVETVEAINKLGDSIAPNTADMATN